MSVSWERVPLSNDVKMLSGGTPKKSEPAYWDGDIPWVSSGEMTQRRIWDTELHVSHEGAQKGSKLVPEKTVLIVVRGMSLAKEFRVSLTQREVTFNQDVKALACSDRILPEFLYYYLLAQAPAIRDSSTDASHGTKKLDTAVLENWPIPIPSLSEQETLIDLLSKYDDLIENNRRRIELLEETARQLFKEWFIRFRFPGHEHVKIIDGVPEGWEFTTIAQVAETVGGGTPSTKIPQYWDDGEITWFVPKDLTQNLSLILLDSEKKITQSGLQKSSAKMLPPETILMSSRASIGYFGLFEGECCTNQGFISIIPKHLETRMYLLHNLMSRKDEIIGLAGGTTYKEINKTTFRGMDIRVPPNHLLEEFEALAYDTVKQVRVLKKQIHALERARDLLLPKLMNGEIAA